jgi:hypothetical protein
MNYGNQTGNMRNKYLRQKKLLALQMKLTSTPTSNADIADRFGINRTTCLALLNDLVNAGCIKSTFKKPAKGIKTSKYFFTFEGAPMYPVMDEPPAPKGRKPKNEPEIVEKITMPFEDKRLCAMMGYTDFKPELIGRVYDAKNAINYSTPRIVPRSYVGSSMRMIDNA